MPPLDIPPGFPLLAILGQEVTQVCIGQSHVRLGFYKVADAASVPKKWKPGANIDIEAGFELQEPNGEFQSATGNLFGTRAGCLTSLLGQTVTACERLERNELLLGFSSGASLCLLTGLVGLESYHLHIEGQSVDVTTC